jgi:class 3 adenylate cyclase
MFMDVHNGLGDATPQEVAEAHQRDLAIQHKHNCRFLTYWLNDPTGQVFCLVEAPDQASAIACHKEAHGLLPHKLVEVTMPTLASFLGGWEQSVPDRATVAGPGTPPDSGLRAIMFTDIEGSTDISTRLGDDRAMQVLRSHNRVVRECLTRFSGREVKHTGDGVLASFVSVTSAVQCARGIQTAVDGDTSPHGAFRVKIGLSAGEPVSESDDLYGAAVNLAARVCAQAMGGEILVSSVVKDLCIGKGLKFAEDRVVDLKGFDGPMRLFRVAAG